MDGSRPREAAYCAFAKLIGMKLAIGWPIRFTSNAAYAADNVEEMSQKVDIFRNLRWEGGEYIPRPKYYVED